MKDKCPFCGNIVDDGLYDNGECSGCGASYYYDYVYVEDTNEVLFDGRYYSKDGFGSINQLIGVEIE